MFLFLFLFLFFSRFLSSQSSKHTATMAAKMRNLVHSVLVEVSTPSSDKRLVCSRQERAPRKVKLKGLSRSPKTLQVKFSMQYVVQLAAWLNSQSTVYWLGRRSKALATSCGPFEPMECGRAHLSQSKPLDSSLTKQWSN
jgi:hypothetical protein